MGVTLTRDDPREGILNAADRRFRHYGYRKTTVEEIAHEAGLSRGTVYLHFGSKDELALAWISRFLGERRNHMKRIAQGPGSPEERLRHMLVERVLFAFDGALSLSESLDDLLSALRQPLMARREEHHESEALVVADVVREAITIGQFEADNPLCMARLLVLATNSLLPYNLNPSQLGRREEIERKALALSDLLLRGLRNTDSCASGQDRHPGNRHE